MDIYITSMLVGGTLTALPLVFTGFFDSLGESDFGFGLFVFFDKIISFLTFFGLCGFLCSVFDLHSVQPFVAVAGGVASVFFSSFILSMAKKHGNVSGKNSSLIGREGKVIVPIKANKTGKVELEVGGQLEQFIAKSSKDLGFGSKIIVVEDNQGILEVEHWQ